MKNFFAIEFKSGRVSSQPRPQLEAAVPSKEVFVWLDLDETEPKVEAKRLLSQFFHFHPWTIKQSLDPTQRPKLEEHDRYLFVIVPALAKSNGLDQRFISLNIFIGKDFVVTVHSKPLQAILDVQHELPRQDPLLHETPAELLYLLLTEVVDDYRPTIEQLDREVDLVETLIFKRADERVQRKIFSVKKKVLSLRRSVQPLREVINFLTNRELGFVESKTRLQFRDTYDHVLRVYDALETFRELMSSAMEAYISQVSNRLSEIMKILSIVATVILPLSLITGIWGTNFRYLPGLEHPSGFWIMIMSMGILGLLMMLFFRWRRWF